MALIPPLPENPGLELALANEPANRDTRAVYSDWLLSHDHPLGELIALELNGLTKRVAHKANRKRAVNLMNLLCQSWGQDLWSIQDSLYRTHLLKTAEGIDSKIGLDWENSFVSKLDIELYAAEPCENMLEKLREILNAPVLHFLSRLQIVIYPGRNWETWYKGPITKAMNQQVLKTFTDLLHIINDSKSGLYLADLYLGERSKGPALNEFDLSPFLSGFPHLSKLNLSGVFAPSTLPAHSLSEFTIFFSSSCRPWRKLLSTTRFKQLESITLDVGSLGTDTDEMIDFILENKSFQDLRHLCLTFRASSGSFRHLLRKLNQPRLTNLTLIIYEESYAADNWRVFQPFFHEANLPALTSLTFDYKHYNQLFLEELACSPLLPGLKQLQISSRSLSDQDVQPLLDQRAAFWHLERIRMRNYRLSRGLQDRLRSIFKERLLFDGWL